MTTVACLYCCSCLFIKMCNNLSMEVSNLQASSSSSLKLSSFSYSSFPTESEPERSYLRQVFQKQLPLLVYDMIIILATQNSLSSTDEILICVFHFRTFYSSPILFTSLRLFAWWGLKVCEQSLHKLPDLLSNHIKCKVQSELAWVPVILTIN